MLGHRTECVVDHGSEYDVEGGAVVEHYDGRVWRGHRARSRRAPRSSADFTRSLAGGATARARAELTLDAGPTAFDVVLTVETWRDGEPFAARAGSRRSNETSREARDPSRGVPWWGLLSATAAPVLLIGGWTVAAAQQRGGLRPGRRARISALAAHGATDRWIMTAALAGLGVCHVVTALALRDRRPRGPRRARRRRRRDACWWRSFPLPADETGSTAHTAVAAARRS